MNLTQKQIEVIELIADGKTSRDIAEIIGMSKYGIDERIKKSLAATGAANSTALVAMSLRKGWIK